MHSHVEQYACNLREDLAYIITLFTVNGQRPSIDKTHDLSHTQKKKKKKREKKKHIQSI